MKKRKEMFKMKMQMARGSRGGGGGFVDRTDVIFLIMADRSSLCHGTAEKRGVVTSGYAKPHLLDQVQRSPVCQSYTKLVVIRPVAIVRAIRIIAAAILIRIQQRPGSQVGRCVRGVVEPPNALRVLEAEEAANGLPHCKDGGEDVDEVT